MCSPACWPLATAVPALWAWVVAWAELCRSVSAERTTPPILVPISIIRADWLVAILSNRRTSLSRRAAPSSTDREVPLMLAVIPPS